jgi:hypothetical protein
MAGKPTRVVGAVAANDGNPPRPDLRRRHQASYVDDPSKQGRSGMLRRGRVRSCVRPTLRGLRTAGPDAIRSLAPKQICALEWRIPVGSPPNTGWPLFAGRCRD